jgi:hypothetical protein
MVSPLPGPSNTQRYEPWILLENEQRPLQYKFSFGPDISNPNLNDLAVSLQAQKDKLKRVELGNVLFFTIDDRVNSIRPGTTLRELGSHNNDVNPLVVRYPLSVSKGK